MGSLELIADGSHQLKCAPLLTQGDSCYATNKVQINSFTVLRPAIEEKPFTAGSVDACRCLLEVHKPVIRMKRSAAMHGSAS